MITCSKMQLTTRLIALSIKNVSFLMCVCQLQFPAAGSGFTSKCHSEGLAVLNEPCREVEQEGTVGSSSGCQGTVKGSLGHFGRGLSAPHAL